MKLKPDYTECHMHIPDTPAYRGGPFLVILTPDGHVWPREGAEEKHPECFKYTFRVGDWVIRHGLYYRIRTIYKNIQEAVLEYGSGSADYIVKESVPLSELKLTPILRNKL